MCIYPFTTSIRVWYCWMMYVNIHFMPKFLLVNSPSPWHNNKILSWEKNTTKTRNHRGCRSFHPGEHPKKKWKDDRCWIFTWNLKCDYQVMVHRCNGSLTQIWCAIPTYKQSLVLLVYHIVNPGRVAFVPRQLNHQSFTYDMCHEIWIICIYLSRVYVECTYV